MTVRVVATAGHVDHGKSTLVRALTGTDPDRFEEEKRRGLTIDLGFARMTTASGTAIDFVDVPGHVRFIKNMLAGVGAVDACLFVVAATEGWMPQTEEHLRILELLGVQRGVIALTMAGLVDDADDLELACMEVEERVAGTFLEDAAVVPIDVLADGLGLAELRDALDALARDLAGASDAGRPRLWVDRSFALPGAGSIVTGTLAGGSVSVGDAVEVVTARGVLDARIRGLQAFGEDHASLAPGCRAALNLAGVAHRAVGRGDAVVLPRRWHHTRSVDVSLHVLASAPNAVRSRGAYIAYLGSGEHPVRLRTLGAASIDPGGCGFARLLLRTELPLLPGDRFVLRDSGSGTTVGGGEVLDVDPVLRPSRAAPDRSIDRVVRERGWVEVDELERLTGARRPPTVERWVVDPEALDRARADLRARVEAAGPTGLDVAALEPRARALLDGDQQITVAVGRATLVTAPDPYDAHPFLHAIEARPFSPPTPAEAGVDSRERRELVRRELAIEQDGIVFARRAVHDAAVVAAALLSTRPSGFTVAEFREALETTRRFAMPLLTLLDSDGITRRRGDLRIAGPRLPDLPPD